jgi:predicted TIM-barrel fold metal-dependent hydrolase
MRRVLTVIAALTTFVGAPALAQDAPRIDHHQHLFGPAVAALLSPPPPAAPVSPITARDVIAHLDRAGIERAVVLSTAYIFEQPTRNVDDAAAKLSAENDWTAQQVAQFPDRLIGFCGLNPLTERALAELARCANNRYLRRGLKLHLGNSGFDYRDPQQVERVRRVFRAANDRRMAIVVHMRASYNLKRSYGRDEALIFLNDLIAAAPDVVIQVAHLGGGGGPNDQASYEALEVLANAVAAGDPRTRRLYFDVTGIGLLPNMTPEEAAMFAARIRQVGVGRILFGSDATSSGNPPPREQWLAFRKLPLNDEEFRSIATNVAPYLR